MAEKLARRYDADAYIGQQKAQCEYLVRHQATQEQKLGVYEGASPARYDYQSNDVP